MNPDTERIRPARMKTFRRLAMKIPKQNIAVKSFVVELGAKGR